MAQLSNEEVVNRYLDAHRHRDVDTLGKLRSKDWYQDWPQSNERVRGHENDIAVMRSWPGGEPVPGEGGRVIGSEDRWVVTPSMTYQRVVGSGDYWWFEGTGIYPDGSTWFTTAVVEVHDGQVHHETWYFGPKLEAPEWRAPWVEQINPPEQSHGR
jgi:hypothetical protein